MAYSYIKRQHSEVGCVIRVITDKKDKFHRQETLRIGIIYVLKQAKDKMFNELKECFVELVA